MLGDLLGAARCATSDIVSRPGALDDETVARLESLARARAESPTTLVRRAFAEFERAASEEDWATLISRLRESDDPGTACLSVMTRWYVARSESELTSVIPATTLASARNAPAAPIAEPSDQPSGAPHER